MGCPIDANATRLHDNVVHKLVVLLRSLGLAVTLEPIRLFDNVNDDDNRRPDILIHNPFGGGAQIILDVAVTNVICQTRRSGEGVDQPLQMRFNQKKTKYDHIARANGLSFIPAIFSHTDQIHATIMGWMFNQIRMKM